MATKKRKKMCRRQEVGRRNGNVIIVDVRHGTTVRHAIFDSFGLGEVVKTRTTHRKECLVRWERTAETWHHFAELRPAEWRIYGALSQSHRERRIMKSTAKILGRKWS